MSPHLRSVLVFLYGWFVFISWLSSFSSTCVLFNQFVRQYNTFYCLPVRSISSASFVLTKVRTYIFTHRFRRRCGWNLNRNISMTLRTYLRSVTTSTTAPVRLVCHARCLQVFYDYFQQFLKITIATGII